MQRLLQELKNLRGSTLVLTHSLADVDSVSSAIVLGRILSWLKKPCDIHCIDSLNSSSKHLLKEIGLAILLPFEGKLSKYSNIIFVDVSNPDLLSDFPKKLSSYRGRVYCIDHHYHSNHLHTRYSFIAPHYAASSLIVFDLAKELNYSLNSREAFLLAAGVVSDTAFFKSADNSCFKKFSELLEYGVDYRRLLTLFASAPRLDEKLAVIKCVQNARIERRGELRAEQLVAFGESSCFESECASALIAAGCGIAFVVNKKRARVSCVRGDALDVNVGKIMESIGKRIHGSGGGHEKVGGAKGKAELIAPALEKEVKLLF